VKSRLRPKEISWLAFNERVLQEAADPNVPLLERIRFLGIYSSNLDEFYRVRVAVLQRLLDLGTEGKSALGYSPKNVLAEIQSTVRALDVTFERVYREILAAMARERVFMLDEKRLMPDQGAFVRAYFLQEVRPRLIPIMIDRNRKFPEMRDQSVYLAVCLGSSANVRSNSAYALIEMPSEGIPRFLTLPRTGEDRLVIMLDDVIRFCLKDVFSIFKIETFDAYTVKLTRDAELDLNDDVSQSYIKKISRSLKHRKKGNPVRFIHDAEMPKSMLRMFVDQLGLDGEDTLIAGGRYHNFKDFMRFPDFGLPHWKYPPIPPLPHPALPEGTGVFEAIEAGDLLFHYPYQSFHALIDLLREASLDPLVESIKCTLYRMARDSSMVNALINAARNGKKVTAVVELQARFDEEANILWANRMAEEGIHVVHGVPGLKVHAKMLLISRRRKRGDLQRFAVVGTGNFNEDTARQYTDHNLFTADARITGEVEKVFDFIDANFHVKPYKHLWVSPFNLRHKVLKAIREESENARAGREAAVVMKLNNLTDPQIIKHLVHAGQAGVRIRLMVRGMFSLVAGVRGVTEGIEARGTVDRFLEHTRIFWFLGGGKERVYISSSDLMPRNLDGRVEVACPIYDPAIRAELKEYLEIHWLDTAKARILDSELKNERPPSTHPVMRAQEAIYRRLRDGKAAAATLEETRTGPSFILNLPASVRPTV
jgi:polyphosphate kinase